MACHNSDSVSVAIANWNGLPWITRCLDAVLAQTHPASEIILVDQGSSDGSRELVRESFPAVDVIEEDRNTGVAGGWNRAIGRSSSPFILILNTDVFLGRDFLCESLRAIQKRSDIGSVAATIYREDDGEIENVGFHLQRWLRPVNSPNTRNSEFVFAGSGAAMLCRREMLEDVKEETGYFDEAFFAYLEDIDLSWRAQLKGWRCVFEPRAKAYHVGSATQGGRVRVLEKQAFFQRHIWKNRYLMVTKNASPAVLLSLLPFIVIYECFYWPMLLVRLPHRLPVFLAAHVDYLRSLPRVLRQRRRIQRDSRVGAERILKFIR